MSEILWTYSKSMVKYINEREYPVIVLTGPSGAGKSTLADFLEINYGSIFGIVPNHTTRPERETDKKTHFVYLSDDNFDKLRYDNEFFLARYMEFPHYGYRNKDILAIMDKKQVPLFMFRFSGLQKIVQLLSNVYVIDIYSDTKITAEHSQDMVVKQTIDTVTAVRNRIETICQSQTRGKIITIKNNYDDSFFHNPILADFIEVINNDRCRFDARQNFKKD